MPVEPGLSLPIEYLAFELVILSRECRAFFSFRNSDSSSASRSRASKYEGSKRKKSLKGGRVFGCVKYEATLVASIFLMYLHGNIIFTLHYPNALHREYHRKIR